MNSYNLCASDLLTPALKKKCFSNDISVQDIAVDAMRSHPDVPFAFVQSKIDDIQQGFYIALGVRSYESVLLLVVVLHLVV